MLRKIALSAVILALIITLCVPWFYASGADPTWTQTTVTDFNAGILGNVEVIDVGGGDGDVQITATTVTLGNSTNNAGAQPYSNDVYIQEDSSYTVPYNGEVTSWSYYNSGSASTTDNTRLEFLTGSGTTWTMQAKSSAVSIVAGTNTFIVSLPVSAGWQIGLYTGTPLNLYYDTSSGMTVTRRPNGAGDFNVGDSRSDFSSNPTRHLPITVDLRYFSSSGTLASQVLNTLTADSSWDELSWNETLPANTDITFEVRADNTPFAVGDSTPSWTDLSPADSPITTGLPSGQYMQWRATLSTTDTSQTPVLHDVTITYTTGMPSGGSDSDTYYPDDDVTVSATDFPFSTNVDVYVVDDYTWSDLDPIPADVGDGMDIIATDPAGNITNEVIWTHPLTIGDYDIVFDIDQNGIYNAISDVVDDPNHPGFTVMATPSPSPTRRTVGGTVYPVDKEALLLPWLGLGIALVLAAGGLILARRAGRLR